jgi:hypothetical protein
MLGESVYERAKGLEMVKAGTAVLRNDDPSVAAEP